MHNTLDFSYLIESCRFVSSDGLLPSNSFALNKAIASIENLCLASCFSNLVSFREFLYNVFRSFNCDSFSFSLSSYNMLSFDPSAYEIRFFVGVTIKVSPCVS